VKILVAPKLIRMVDHEQTHVWYGRCPVCNGTWLDAGEFTDLKHTPSSICPRRIQARTPRVALGLRALVSVAAIADDVAGNGG
jgi:hypothetical protein